MSEREITDEIKIELENLSSIIKELKLLLGESRTKELSIRDKTAAGSFLAQFYNGIENILKRICKLKRVDLPKGELWHVEIFKLFCEPPHKDLPLIFDDLLEKEFSAYRRFRHIVHHGYCFQLKWEMMREGIEKVEGLFSTFQKSILDLINKI